MQNKDMFARSWIITAACLSAVMNMYSAVEWEPSVFVLSYSPCLKTVLKSTWLTNLFTSFALGCM